MLNKLRVQFVLGATLAVLIALMMVMVPVYFLVGSAFTAQMDAILDVLIQNDGDMPVNRVRIEGNRFIEITEEQQFETRFFSVKFDENGEAVNINTSYVFSIDEDEALQIAGQIRQRGRLSGSILYDGSRYLYKSALRFDETLIVFVDCTSRYWIIRQAMMYLIVVGLVILLIFSLIIGKLSTRIVQPFIENSEKQKRFITNASHELKTPLAVISANTEMQELEGGKTKWTEATMRQVKRLNALVSELVTLSRLDEKDEIKLSDVNATVIVKEQADSFEQVVTTQNKHFERSIADDVIVKAEERSVQELCSILLDNAAKYCDEGGCVKIELTGGKNARLTVSNDYAAGEGVDYRRFFDRFYREDESHNSKKSGFGIGLSIAQEIARRLGTRIQVSYKNKTISFSISFR